MAELMRADQPEESATKTLANTKHVPVLVPQSVVIATAEAAARAAATTLGIESQKVDMIASAVEVAVQRAWRLGVAWKPPRRRRRGARAAQDDGDSSTVSAAKSDTSRRCQPPTDRPAHRSPLGPRPSVASWTMANQSQWIWLAKLYHLFLPRRWMQEHRQKAMWRSASSVILLRS